MDGRDLADAAAAEVVRIALAAFVAGVVFCLFVIKVIPWLWQFIKPWIHAVTG